jgi:hypothetical protein
MPEPTMRRRTLLAAGVVGVVGTVLGPAALSAAATTATPTDLGPSRPSGSVSVAALEQSTFAPAVGTTFSVRSSAGSTTDLVLASVTPLPNGPAGPRRFSLMFHGPDRPVLPQGIYPMSHPGIGSFELFIAAVGLPGSTQAYQAIFDA